MRLMTTLRTAAVASLLFSVPVLAQTSAAPEATPSAEKCERGGHGHKGMRFERKFGRMEHKLDRKVAEGRLTQAQADQFKAEARQLRDEMKAVADASGGQLSDAQRQQFKERRRALHSKVKEALKATAPQSQGA